MDIVADRRALHQIPELDRDLEETFSYLRSRLQGLKCQVFSPEKGFLCAFFDFGQSRAIAFRSDADALPIQEQTGLPFASRHPGKMHACGHDGHMAIVLELARRLDALESLPQNVLLVFQGGEETTGGARDLCKTGIFFRYAVEGIFAIHLWPGLPAGAIASRESEMMSRSSEVRVEITGRSAHIAKAGAGIDAMAAGVDFYQQVTQAEQALPDCVFRLLKFGKFQSGTVCNAISGHTLIHGSLRAFQDSVFDRLRQEILDAGDRVARRYGCQVEIRFSDGYPPLINPPALYRRVRERVPFAELAEPSMITEDFSWYQRCIPGVFFFLGTGDTPALHADNFCFDESILEKGADFFLKLAMCDICSH